MNLGERIRTAREAASLSQEALADLIGVDKRTIGNWERGQATPRSRLGALERVLGVQLRGSPPRDAPRLDEATDAEFISELAARLANRTRTINDLRAQLAATLGHAVNGSTDNGDNPRPVTPIRWAARAREATDQ